MEFLEVKFVSVPDWEHSGALERLLYDMLYADWGLEFADPAWRSVPPDATTIVATVPHGGLLGAASLLPAAGDAERQVRQVAVVPDLRGRGVGRVLMEAAEFLAVSEGADALWLNARDSAFPFYEALGYSFDGPEFVSELTGIPHRRMRKGLAG